VQLINDTEIYISWFVQKKKKERSEHKEEEDFPNLMNLKKMANKYR
jgi:hypothetical protein